MKYKFDIFGKTYVVERTGGDNVLNWKDYYGDNCSLEWDCSEGDTFFFQRKEQNGESVERFMMTLPEWFAFLYSLRPELLRQVADDMERQILDANKVEQG